MTINETIKMIEGSPYTGDEGIDRSEHFVHWYGGHSVVWLRDEFETFEKEQGDDTEFANGFEAFVALCESCQPLLYNDCDMSDAHTQEAKSHGELLNEELPDWQERFLPPALRD